MNLSKWISYQVAKFIFLVPIFYVLSKTGASIYSYLIAVVCVAVYGTISWHEGAEKGRRERGVTNSWGVMDV